MSVSRLDTLRGQIAPITAIALFGLSLSLSYPLFALLLERMGASGAAIGLNQTGPAIAIVLFAPIMPVLLARVRLVPLMVCSVIVLAVVMLAAPIWRDFWAWAALRAVHGFAATALFYASEFWIVGAAPDASRGRIVAVYTVSLSVAFMAGPLLLGLIGVDGLLPFAIAAAIPLLGIAPILWGRGTAPDPTDREPASARAALRFFRTDPAVVWGVTLFGMIEFGVLGLIPVWAVRSGLAEAQAVALLAAFALGSIAFQWPIGRAADRHDRRKLLALAGAACFAAPLAMIAGAPAVWLLGAAILVWGGLAVALYSLALVEMGARYRGTRLSEANAAIILGYGFGAVAAPIGLGYAMDRVPPDGVLWVAALAAAGYLALLATRRSRAKALDSRSHMSR